MTLPFAKTITHAATARPIVVGADSSYNKPADNEHGFGVCRTPHPIRRETILWRGYCPLCVANGAGMEEDECFT